MRFVFSNFLLLQGISIALSLMDQKAKYFSNFVDHSMTKTKFQKKITAQQLVADKFDEYGKHLMSRGSEIIKDSAKRNLRAINQMSKKIFYVSNDYKLILHRYFEFTAERYAKQVGVPIDIEFLLLNMLQMSSELLYHKKWEIVRLANADMESTKQFINAIPTISKLIKKRNRYERKLEMKYICAKYNVCKPYPAFTDYFEDFLLELLSLSDRQLEGPMNYLITILAINNDLETILSGIKNKKLLYTQVAKLYNKTNIKEMLTEIRTVLYNRNKFYDAPNVETLHRHQAIRSLLNAINEAFRDVNILDDFEETIKAIKTWNDGEMPKIVVEKLVEKIFKTIKKINDASFNDLVDKMVTGKFGDVSHVFQGFNGVYV